MARKQGGINMDRLQAVLNPLCTHPDFEEFMAFVEELKDEAVEASVSFETVASERNSLAAKGEVRAYLNILAIYKNQREQLEQMPRPLD